VLSCQGTYLPHLIYTHLSIAGSTLRALRNSVTRHAYLFLRHDSADSMQLYSLVAASRGVERQSVVERYDDQGRPRSPRRKELAVVFVASAGKHTETAESEILQSKSRILHHTQEEACCLYAAKQREHAPLLLPRTPRPSLQTRARFFRPGQPISLPYDQVCNFSRSSHEGVRADISL